MATIQDRIVSALSYFTFSIFGIIWLIYVNVAKKTLTEFAQFNILQSVFITVVLVIINYIFGIIVKLASTIPFLAELVNNLIIFLNGTPKYFGFSLVGLIINILIIYLAVFAILGKRPFVPVVSKIISYHTRG